MSIGDTQEHQLGIYPEKEYWKPHVSNSSALSVPKISKAVAARKK